MRSENESKKIATIITKEFKILVLFQKMEPINCRALLEPLSCRSGKLMVQVTTTKVSCSKEMAEGTGLEPA